MPRKYTTCWQSVSHTWPSFNEAGADAPEIRSKKKPFLPRVCCFNEAGADAPEIQYTLSRLCSRVLASMRPGRMPRKYKRWPAKPPFLAVLQ